jgi:HAD superfamily hydrolase (TIGR01458 family)
MDKGFVIDLEGTLVSSGIPLPGSIEFINYLNKNCIKYYIITNTVSRTPETWEKLLKDIGLEIRKENIIYPIVVLNDFIKENAIKTYYFIGPDNLKNLVQRTMDYENNPEYIIFCDFEYANLNYEMLNKIFKYIRNGSKIIATSYSNYYISKNEYKMDTGIFVKMYETLVNEKAVIMGKPSQIIYKTALKRLGMDTNNVITIGDDGLTDIVGGKEMEMETILVKTGKYKDGDEKKYKPSKVVNNLEEVMGGI